jgi:hypothetical protein
MATKIKGRKYHRVKAKKNGSCPVGARKMARGKSRRESCYELVGKK